jgi:hypothetical protein
MPTMTAPAPFASFQAKSGTQYSANAKAVITGVAVGDVVDLINSGCVLGSFSTSLILLHGRNADGTVLDATGGAGKFKTTVTLATSLVLAGEAANTNTKTDDVIFEALLPATYVAGDDVTVTVNAKVAGAGTPGTKTLAVKAYRTATDGSQGANIGPAAQALTTANADYAFAVAGASLSPGDRLLIELEAVIQETGGPTSTPRSTRSA